MRQALVGSREGNDNHAVAAVAKSCPNATRRQGDNECVHRCFQDGQSFCSRYSRHWVLG